MTTKSIGSTDIMRSPSSCSVATMVPISAAVAEPARPVVEQRRQHRAELADQAQPDDRAERLVGAEAHQRVVALQAEHHADGEPADADDDERQHAELVELVDEAARRRHGGVHARRARSRPAKTRHARRGRRRTRMAAQPRSRIARSPSAAPPAASTGASSSVARSGTRATRGSVLRAQLGGRALDARRPGSSTSTWSAMRMVDGDVVRDHEHGHAAAAG